MTVGRPIAHVLSVVASPYRAADHVRFGTETMRRRNIRCTVVDATAVCHPRVPRPDAPWRPDDGTEVIVLDSAHDLAAIAARPEQADLILMLATNGLITADNLPVLRWVSHARTPYVLACSNACPGVDHFRGGPKDFINRLRSIVQRLPAFSPLRSLIARAPLALLGLRPAEAVFYGGRKSRIPQRLIAPGTREIWLHALDYDNVLAGMGRPRAQTTDTAVFLDQYLPFHPDWTLVPDFGGIDSENYFGGLRVLFDRIERDLGLRVVVAAHPRADYGGREDLFGGREIVHGRTEELVRTSRLVINSTSLAVSYAILHRKPVLLYSTRDHYPHPAVWRYLDPICAELNRRLIFLENAASADLTDVLRVEQPLYDRYIENYIKTPASPDRSFWESALELLSAPSASPTPVHAR